MTERFPFAYESNDLLVIQDLPPAHWKKASIPPVNFWAEKLDEAARAREASFAARGIRKAHFGVGDTNWGVDRDTLIAGIDLLTHETKRNDGSFALSSVDIKALADYMAAFPVHGTHEDVQFWHDERPVCIIDALERAISNISAPYGKMSGWGPAIDAHKRFLHRHVGVDARDYLVMTSGDRNAVFNATQAVRQHMLETRRPNFLLVTPSWGTFAVIIQQFYGEHALITLECPQGAPDADQLDQVLREHPDIGCIVMCNPNNPTGEVLDRMQLASIAHVMHKHKVPGIFDELYMLFVYQDKHCSMARVAADLCLRERSVEVGRWLANNIIVLGVGVQKAAGSGFRCNAAWIPNGNLRGRFVASIGACTGQPAILSQAVMTSVINNNAYVACYQEMTRRRNAVIAMLRGLQLSLIDTPFTLEHTSARGGIYVGVYLRGLTGTQYRSSLNGASMTIRTSEDLAEWLVDQAGIIAGPASTTLIDDPSFVRFSYGNINAELIPAAGRQIKEALHALFRANTREYALAQTA